MKEDDNRYKAWNPYLAGALSGIVIVASVWLTGKYAGASTSFVRTAGMIEKFIDPARLNQIEYFAKEAPVIEWQWMFVIGILAGSLISSVTSGSFSLTAIPPMWKSRFGNSIALRAPAAFTGGAVAMFGARLADG